MTSRARWTGAIGLALVVGLGGLAGLAGRSDRAHTAEVRRGDLVVSVETSGVLRAVESSLVGPPQMRDVWEFKIVELAAEGEEVAAGAPLVRFDTGDLRQRLERQRAEGESARKQIERTEKSLAVSKERDELRLVEAESRLHRAQLVLDAPQELSSSKALAEARLDLELAELELRFLRERVAAAERSASAQLAALHAQLQRAESRTAEIEQAIASMERLAPRAGTVIYVTDWNDEKPKVGDSVWRGRQVVELPDLSKMEADARVDESDAGRLAEGQRVTLRLDAHPDVEFTGRVESIWSTVEPASAEGSPLKVVRLEIELERTDPRRMRPGMRFRGRIELERVPGTLLVPAEAVFLRGEGPTVYRKGLGGWEAVRVELGRRGEGQVEVRRGLEAGDEVSLVDPEAAA